MLDDIVDEELPGFFKKFTLSLQFTQTFLTIFYHNVSVPKRKPQSTRRNPWEPLQKLCVLCGSFDA